MNPVPIQPALLVPADGVQLPATPPPIEMSPRPLTRQAQRALALEAACNIRVTPRAAAKSEDWTKLQIKSSEEHKRRDATPETLSRASLPTAATTHQERGALADLSKKVAAKAKETTEFGSTLERSCQLEVSAEQNNQMRSAEQNEQTRSAEQNEQTRSVNMSLPGTSQSKVCPAPDINDLPDHSCWTPEEFQNEIKKKLQLNLDQLDLQRRLWEESRLEWSKQLELMVQVIKTTVENQASTLRFFVMHEIEVLKRDLLNSLSQRQATSNSDNPDISTASPQFQMSGLSVKQAGNVQSTQTLNVSLSSSNNTGTAGGHLLADPGGLLRGATHSPLVTRMSREGNRRHEVMDCQLTPGNRRHEVMDCQLTPGNRRQEVVNCQLTPGNRRQKVVNCQLTPGNRRHEVVNCQLTQDVTHHKNGSKLCSENNSSFLQNTQPSVSVKNRTDSGMSSTRIHSDTTFKQAENHQTVEQTLPNKYPEPKADAEREYFRCLNRSGRFTVFNCESVSSTTPFYSCFIEPFYSTFNKNWRARVRLMFDEKNELQVNILITAGENNNAKNWPLLFTGTGSIYHPSSKKFTPIWRMKSKVCQNPEASELVLQTKTFLKKNKNLPVTYEDLKFRNYVKKSTLMFYWTIQYQRVHSSGCSF